MLALVAMVTRRALAAVLLEANKVTGAAMLARIREADVALCKDVWIGLVCIERTKQQRHCTTESQTYILINVPTVVITVFIFVYTRQIQCEILFHLLKQSFNQKT